MFFAILAAATSVAGTMSAARAAQTQSSQQAKQMEIDRKINEASAMQQRNQRFSDYVSARSANNAQFSFLLGGGESTSVQAFQDAQREIVGEDLRVAERQQMFESSSRTVGSLIERQRGRSAMTAGSINSLSTLFQLGSDLSKTYTGGAGYTGGGGGGGK